MAGARFLVNLWANLLFKKELVKYGNALENHAVSTGQEKIERTKITQHWIFVKLNFKWSFIYLIAFALFWRITTAYKVTTQVQPNSL